MADNQTAEQADMLFNHACELAIDVFAATGEVPAQVLVSPADSPDTLVGGALIVPPPGPLRHRMWDMVRIMAVALDAVAIVNVQEFWHSPSGHSPAHEASDRGEGVIVVMVRRHNDQMLQRTAHWPIMRDADGGGTLGEKTITPDQPASTETQMGTLLPVRRPDHAMRRMAAEALAVFGVHQDAA